VRPFHSRRPALVSLVAALALVCGPLSFAPARAAGLVVTGLVVDSTGAPVRSAIVEVWVEDEGEGAFVPEDFEAYTDRNGRYRLVLDPGTYRLGIAADDRYVSEYYNDASRLRDATSVVVTDTAVGLDTVELELRPTVRGTLLSAAGGPVPYGYVLAYADDPDEGWTPAHFVDVADDGSFALPVDPGTYRIGFGDEDDDYREEFWDDSPSISGAKDVVVGDRGVTGIDAVLTPRPVTPPRYDTISNWSRPSIDGYPATNMWLSAGDGSWSHTPSLTRQWLRNGAPIPGATGHRYRATPADVGATLSVRVTASAPFTSPSTVTSPEVGPIRWHTRLDATARTGRKKATVRFVVTSHGPGPRGTVQLSLRGKVVKTARVRHGRAVMTLRHQPQRKVRYDVLFIGDSTVYGARDAVWVTIKKPRRK
jgi:hypothetical protein